jgi:hypothetical protein
MSDHEMTIIPQSFEENFVICSRFTAQDENLSFAAKGLLWNLLSRPKDWIIHTNELAKIYKGKKQRGNGSDAIDEMIKELKELRYIYYKRSRLFNGQFKHIYIIFHTPYTDQQIQKMFPEGDYPPVVNPALVNPPIYKEAIEKGDIEKQQQPQTPSLAVGFYSCLINLELPDSDKRALMKFDKARVTLAIEWARHPKTKITKTLIQALIWFCQQEHPPAIPIDEHKAKKEIPIDEHKAAALKLQDSFKLEPSNPYRYISASDSSITFKDKMRDIYQTIAYADREFWPKFKHMKQTFNLKT